MIHLRRETIPVDVIEEIVTLGEGYKTEFKATLPAPLAVAKSICAFSNTKGGNLFVGINDSSVPVGVINKEYELNKLEKALPLLLPNPEVSVKILGFRNTEIILIEVKEGSDKPYYVKNGDTTQAYVRTGSVSLPANKRAIKKFLGGRGGKSGNLSRDEKVVFNLFQQNSRLKISQIRESLNYSERRVLKILETLARRGLLISSPGENNVFYRTQDASGQTQRERGFRGG
jgi:Schlafen, AlbA_2/Winged helix DNA-binding domain